MAPKFTATEILKFVRDHGIPDTGAEGYTDADVLDRANEYMYEEAIPEIASYSEEFFVIAEQFTLVGTTGRQRIPGRASGNRLTGVSIVIDSRFYKLSLIGRNDRQQYAGSVSSSRQFGAFYLEGNDIVLVPLPTTGATFTGELEVAYLFRPGEVVKSDRYSRIASSGVSGSTITVEEAPGDTIWPTTATEYDIHSYQSGAEIKQWSQSATKSGNVLTFSGTIDGSDAGTKVPAEGDYVCLAEEAALPGLPREAHMTVAQGALTKLLEAMGDTEGVQVAAAKLNRQTKKLSDIVGGGGRVEGNPRLIKCYNSPFFAGRRSGGFSDSFAGQ